MTIHVEQLSHRYGNIEALRDVTVKARPGAITAIVGPNAAGKSTLMRCMIGALHPSAGGVIINGSPAHRQSAANLARQVAYVPQRPLVAAAFTVREVVEMGRYALPSRPKRIEHAMNELELTELADRPFATLSNGQQQRVTVARALAQLNDDGHLILDEPTSAMDLLHVQRTMSLLCDRAERGVTVLLVLHDLTTAAAIADEAWLLDDGRLMASGPVNSVLTPERLTDIFHVRFRWIEQAGGRLLVAEHLSPGFRGSTTMKPA